MLLLDIGNSRIKWAWADGAELSAPGQAGWPGEDLRRVFDTIAAAGPPPARVLISNVAGPGLAGAASSHTEDLWGVQPEFAQPEAAAGSLVNGYADHRQMGVDRWLALLAAWQQRQAAVCVVDAGTAVTVDLIAADGRHQGGFISPGIDMMTAALRERSGAIAAASSAEPSVPDAIEPGFSTASAIERGAMLAAAGMAERARRVFGRASIDIILTGGSADRLRPWLARDGVETRPALVLEGLLLQASSR